MAQSRTPNTPPNPELSPDQNALIQQILAHAEADGVGPRELIDMVNGMARTDLAGTGMSQLDQSTRQPLPRHSPPAKPTRFTLRIDIIGAKPPIWRRISVPSDITLDRLHLIVQEAFGWTSSHLHRFTTSDDRYQRTTQAIVTPFDIEEGEDGILESDLRLDELVREPGDLLHYTYDFGDDWEHTLRLEKSESRASDDDGCSCLTGSRAVPPEDSGGIHYYQHMLQAAADTRHPEHRDMAERMQFYNVTANSAAAFDVEGADRAVARAVRGPQALAWMQEHGADLPIALTDVFDALGEEAQQWLAGLVGDAQLDEPLVISAADAEAATHVVRILLDHIGEEGVALTSAGYLPPANVSSLVKELDTDSRWIGKANREIETYPVLLLREITTALGLLRKYRGRLLLTKSAQKLRNSPLELWWFIARRLPLETPARGRDASVFVLLQVAAGEATDRESLTAATDLFAAMLGWQFDGHGRYGNDEAIDFAADTMRVLEWAATGQLFHGGRSDVYPLALESARLVARAALSPM